MPSPAQPANSTEAPDEETEENVLNIENEIITNESVGENND